MQSEKRDGLAQFSLGGMYADGDYVIPDYKLAIKWLEKSR
ncbi:SEL1-like repeat protein [Salmonella enterica]|uniref:SEL1-like repeat protein n=2 Tax=Salmonella enterica TaxID=28901 RepID=A0A622QJX7_SALDZ|nr:SEL1-like repeat protein [Salmonella enterica]EBH8062380.1 SEL1-like repeat protein [Salmonella bongori]EBP3745530.1 SEL1-like repeat protein [Salmonella enterica subsp. arizonae]EBT7752434.1 SEL1-like repeat protein [Salmonella enterica subsp. diarizonae serovar 61:k:1,5,7]ECI2309918.1 SEL1-like repeat protein [Salmonella enterica subsp. enterica serovar Infantis]EDN4535931.1 SEL1-like repeat protein [Salmonella enterica subsp. diarizonae serovar 47:k:z35]EDQ3841967.1 SEL1-like repeat pro